MVNDNKEMIKKLEESIAEHMKTATAHDPVTLGNKFCEWCLYNVFDLREDEVEEVSEIGGQFDNGIDAVFEINDDIYIIQCKYNNAHTLDSILRFNDDMKRILTEEPITNRQVVKEQAKKIRERFEKNDKIHCFYITSAFFSQLEQIRINELRDLYSNVEINFVDIEKIKNLIEEKAGALPIEFKGKKINLSIVKKFEVENSTIVAVVQLKDFAKFILEGGNYLYHSNIRNYLNKTSINTGIENTLKNDSEKFWYYNNGVTMVCSEYTPIGNVVDIVEPQIVNGCQTAKSIERFFGTKTEKQIEKINGNLLVKIIKTNRNVNEDDKQNVRDNITRYTNSQNAVKGLDFYSLNQFQRNLKLTFAKIGYYYEIQRGSFITERSKQKDYKGTTEYNYLVNEHFKYSLPAKEVMQAFTAGIKQRPDIAYGKPSEITPIGEKWDILFDQDTKNLDVIYFLFPFLVLTYAKNHLNYGKRSINDIENMIFDYKKSASLLYVSTYFKLLLKAVESIYKNSYELEKPDKISSETYKKIFEDKELNEKLLKLTDNILQSYFEDFTITELVANDFKNFLKISIIKEKPWHILGQKIEFAINRNNNILTMLRNKIT